MEDVLEVCQRSYGPDEVWVCMDETSQQQVEETRVPRAQRPGTARVYDDERGGDGSGEETDAITATIVPIGTRKDRCCRTRYRKGRYRTSS